MLWGENVSEAANRPRELFRSSCKRYNKSGCLKQVCAGAREPSCPCPGSRVYSCERLKQGGGAPKPLLYVHGGGATGRMHSKPQGFSTQPIAQLVTSMLVLVGHPDVTFEYMGDVWAQYPRRALNCKKEGRACRPGAHRHCPRRVERIHDEGQRAHCPGNRRVRTSGLGGVTCRLCAHEAACRGNTRHMRCKRRSGPIQRGRMDMRV